MGKIHRGIPQAKALMLKDKYNLKFFVETGTFLGRTTFWASRYFTKVVSVEANFKFYTTSRRYCSGLDNVRIVHAHSEDVLGDILRQIPSPALIWLDAHWSKDLGYQPDSRLCPVMEEIDHINRDEKSHVIIVDDARLFGKVNGWPTLGRVVESLFHGERVITIEEDVIIAEP